MNPSLLLPGCEKAPASPNLSYIPPNSDPHKVKESDDWWKLAALPAVKAAGLSALDLCVYNFKTRVPAEINWYLRNKVGCSKTTSDKKNYAFSSTATPGIIYLPKSTTSGGVIDGRQPGFIGNPPAGNQPPGDPGSASSQEFTVDKETPLPIAVGPYVLFKIKITGKIVVQWGNASPDFKAKVASNLMKKEITMGGEKKLSDDLSLQFGAKIDAKSLANPEAWRKTLKEGVEATVKKKFKNPVIGSVETGLRLPKDGLLFLVKFSTQEFTVEINDLSWLFDLPSGEFTSLAKASLQLTFTLGPGPAAVQAASALLASPAVNAGAAFGGLVAWVAFCGYAIAAGYKKSDDMAFYTWYVSGFVDEVLPTGGGFQLPPNPKDRLTAQDMIRLGRQDAKKTATREFSGLNMDPVEAYRASLLIMIDSDGPTATSMARAALRKMVCAKLLHEKGIKTF